MTDSDQRLDVRPSGVSIAVCPHLCEGLFRVRSAQPMHVAEMFQRQDPRIVLRERLIREPAMLTALDWLVPVPGDKHPVLTVPFWRSHDQ